MGNARIAAAALAAASLSGCGGDSGSPPTSTPTPTPSVSVTLASDSADVSVAEGEQATFEMVATVSGNVANFVPDVRVNGSGYELVGSPNVAGNTVTATFRTLPFQPAGTNTSTVSLRVCSSANCSVVYANSSKTFTVNLDFQLDDWATFQRNNRHDAYVAVRYDEDDFERAWTWQDSSPEGRIRPAAASDGRVLIVAGRDGGIPFAGTMRVLALDAQTGVVEWTYDLGDAFHASGPSISGGRVHVTSMANSSSQNPQWVLDLETGSFLNQMKFASQWTDFNQPAADGADVYVAAGTFGSVLYGYDAAAGTKVWETTRDGGAVWGGQSLGLDDRYAYYYSGVAIDRFERSSGTLAGSIADPDYTPRTYDYEAGPVLDRNGKVYFFSGDKGFFSSNKIVAASFGSKQILWRTSAEYSTAFALRNNVIYAVRQDARVLSAINTENGQVLWSAQLPPAEKTSATLDPIAGNVIVTENHAFVSSAFKTWAIDLTSREVVWEANTGGRLAITPDNYLLTTGSRNLSQLTAYRLAP